jgi:hypothetical protein
MSRSTTGYAVDRYQKRVLVRGDGSTETTYAAHDPERYPHEGHWREITQQAFSKAKKERPGLCWLVVRVEGGSVDWEQPLS